jgi:hypothetical protein
MSSKLTNRRHPHQIKPIYPSSNALHGAYKILGKTSLSAQTFEGILISVTHRQLSGGLMGWTTSEAIAL